MTETRPIARHSLENWMLTGRGMVAAGLDYVEIEYRTPVLADDRLTPGDGWGWMYGWRWLAPDEPSYSHTLPEAIFRHLPACPYPEVERERKAGNGIMPRWRTPTEAKAALGKAAIAWAKAENRKTRRRARHV